MRLTTKEAAARLGVSVNSLRQRLKQGQLKGVCDVYVSPSGRRTYVFYKERIDAHVKGGAS